MYVFEGVDSFITDKRNHFPTFQPSILPNSTAIAQRTGWTDKPVEERLSHTSKLKYTEESTSGSQSGSGEISRSFLSRLDVYEASKADKAALRRDLVNRDCSFQPCTNSGGMKHLSARRAGESTSKTFHRLAVEDPIQREMRQIARETNSCSFSPEIDPYSEILAASRRALDPGYTRTKPSPPSIAEEKPDVATARKPTSRRYAHVRGKYDFRNPDQILAVFDETRRTREARSEHHRIIKAQAELAECTFQPNSLPGERRKLPSLPNSARPVLIAGLSKFLKDKKQRPAETRPTSTVRTGCLTIPSPFVFHSSN